MNRILILFTILAPSYVFSQIPVNNLTVWLRADSGVVLQQGSDLYVERWEDQSGNGYHVEQSSTLVRPFYKDYDGIKRIDFSSSSLESLAKINLSHTDKLTLFIVYRADNDLIPSTIFELADSNNGGFKLSAISGQQTSRIIGNKGINEFTSNFPESRRFSVVTCVADKSLSGRETFIRVNGDTTSLVPKKKGGGLNQSTDNTDNFGMYKLYVGKEKYIEADIAEILLYDTSLNADTIVNIENQLLSKYGLFHASVKNVSDIVTWQLYPNPTCNLLHISGSKELCEDQTVSIYNNLGEEVLNQHFYTAETSIPLSLEDGIYSIRISGCNTYFTQKLLILGNK